MMIKKIESKGSKNMANDLRSRASRNFKKYLDAFLLTGEAAGLPHERLSESEWKQLNEELKQEGVVLVPGERDGYVYYWFTKYDGKNAVKDLRKCASKNFKKYLDTFLLTGETTGLPHERLSKSEWQQLNEELKQEGVVLVPHEHKGYLYYWFEKYDKTKSFQTGKENVKSRLIEAIKKKYPGISDLTIQKILESKKSLDSDEVYNIIRYKQDGQYDSVSEEEFINAFIYALESASNKIELFEHSQMHKWSKEAEKYEQHHYGRGEWDNWPETKRCIGMSGTQGWTWFRFCDCIGKLPPVKDKNNPDGFHISLNVNVCKELLKVLDDILIEDGGAYIDSYKFPKTNYYDEILTRHDPVTIYINARNPELEQKIVRAVAPFVRSNDGMIGESLGKGVCINPETSSRGISVGKAMAIDIVNMVLQSDKGL